MSNVFSAVLHTLKNNITWTVLGIVVISSAVYVTNLQSKLANAEEAKIEAQLRVDSIEARADTTREIKSLLEDSLRFFERRVIQTELKNDSLDQALNRESRARAEVETQLDSLHTEIQSDSVVEVDSVRTAKFQNYDEPFTVNAEVLVPPPPQRASMTLDVKIDPIPLEVRIGCSEGTGEIQKATLGITSPEWATINIREVMQDPAVCNPVLEQPDRSWFDRHRGILGAIFGVVSTVSIGLTF